ncbi:MAG TPA: hypothetical protein VHV55_21420 [Pirellulales bacterium]|jgi:uncharacterized protein involved in exopolysaccharide biosynthesis|nr:hypothetical protein [Pirellulales bacterium]
MAPLPVSLTCPSDLVRLVIAYPRRWFVPAALVALLGLTYALVRTDKFEASQALIVRNEVAGNSDSPGRFRHSDEMKTLLETVLELAKSHGVLEQALIEVGPPDGQTGNWPADQDVVELSDALKVTPPKGAEFGKTEVFYVKVTSTSKARALALATAVTDQLESRYNTLRGARAGSLLAEVNKTVELAQVDLSAVTTRLQKLEQQVGGDLAELRNLHHANSGESDLRRKCLELDGELRQAQMQERNSRQLLDSLIASQNDPHQLLATPTGLLEAQPALKHLKDGLMDAQMKTAQLLGTMSAVHPQVLASHAAEQEIAGHLKHELSAAIRGAELDWELAADRATLLEKQRASLASRLERLAGLRAEYSSLLAESESRTRVLEAGQRELVEARAAQAGSRSASLISRLDAPQVGGKPVGPSRAMIVLAGIFGGLALGLGVLLVSIQPALPTQAELLSQPESSAPALGHVLSLKKALAKSISQ